MLHMHFTHWHSFVGCSGHEKRSGPGRKSKAEHAIAFFEYALESVASNDDDSDTEEDQQSASSSSESNEGEEKTVESMDSHEFLNQHNDFCDVCNLGGELLCCSTCNLVFHLECVRPTLETLPVGDWSCPLCIISGSAVVVPGKEGKQVLKRNSKVWKASAAGVRQMGRLRKASESKKKGDGKPDNERDDGIEEDKASEDDSNHSSSEETEFHRNEASDDDDEKPRKKNMQLYKIKDSLSPTLKVEEGSAAVRGKRPRKPVTLYDPQNCPASEWQSDGQVDRCRSDSDKQHSAKKGNDDADNAASMEKAKSREDSSSSESDNDNDESSTKWCKFCNDDASVPLCVFCACRVCFGKHDKAKLLLCDNCDEEYHSYCLDPPLTYIPKGSKKWFCPGCDTSDSSPRHPKTRRTSLSTPKASGATASKTTPDKASSIGRPRGRPRKSSLSITTPTPRKRGRPPKSASSTPSSASPTPRKRGRPPKNPIDADSRKRDLSLPVPHKDTPSNKKARASLASSESKSPLSSPEKDEPENVKTSRSGRMLKRSSFHDERDEGEQHLRSARHYPEKLSPTMTLRTASHDVEQGVTRNTDADPPKASPVVDTPAEVPNNNTASAPTIDENSMPGSPVPAKSIISPPAAVIATAAVAQTVQTSPSTDARLPGTSSTLKKGETNVPSKPRPIMLSNGGNDLSAKASLPPKKDESAHLPAFAPQALSEQSQRKPLPSTTGAVPAQPKVEEKVAIPTAPLVAAVKKVAAASTAPNIDVPALVAAAIKSAITAGEAEEDKPLTPGKVPRRKPGARECMQISRRFGVRIIPEKYMDTLLDYCTRGKVEHLIRMRERLDEHSRFLESQLAGLEAVIREKGESDAIVPPLPDRPDSNKPQQPATAPR